MLSLYTSCWLSLNILADLLSNCNVRLFIIFQVWYDFEAVRWLIIWMCFSETSYLWIFMVSYIFYFLLWCQCILGPFLNFWTEWLYLNFDHIRLKIVFSVPFKVKMSFPRPFYFDFSIFELSLRFFQYLVAFLATNSSELPVLSIFEKEYGATT